MKKVALLTLAIGLTQIAAVPALAQSTDKMDSKMSASVMDVMGTVKQVDGKITFVADKDGSSWDVMNPETLTAHVGHRVTLNAHVYADQHKIHVIKVTMTKM